MRLVLITALFIFALNPSLYANTGKKLYRTAWAVWELDFDNNIMKKKPHNKNEWLDKNFDMYFDGKHLILYYDAWTDVWVTNDKSKTFVWTLVENGRKMKKRHKARLLN